MALNDHKGGDDILLGTHDCGNCGICLHCLQRDQEHDANYRTFFTEGEVQTILDKDDTL